MKRKNDSKNQKQYTLEALKVTKRITHWNREVSVDIPKIAKIETKNVKRPNCDNSFGSNQVLPVRLKCVNSSSLMNNETLLSQFTMVAKKEPIDSALVEARSVLSEVVDKVVGNDAQDLYCKATGRRETSSVFFNV